MLSIVSGELYQCDLTDCSDARPLEQAAVQGFRCYGGDSCEAISYEPFHRFNYLEIEFSDGKTRRSNVFENQAFRSQYDVSIREDDLLVTGRFVFDLLTLCGCSALLTSPAAVLAASGRRRRG